MEFNESENSLLLLNGPSSAGKSSIAGELQRELRRYSADPVIISIDDYMKIGTDEEIWEDDIFEVMPDMCRDITPALQQGKWVIVDHVITSARIYDVLLDAAAGFDVVKVLVSCSLEILLKRERERGNRFAGSAEASLKYLYPKDGYDLRIDSGKTDAASSAEKIMDFLQDRQKS
jgi:chloramphenicol 3-O phosphotransferase